MTDAPSTTDHLAHDVKLAESPSGVPNLISYRDDRGNWTIGFGHLMEDQSDAAAGVTITAAQADELLDDDLMNAKIQTAQLPEWPHLYTVCRKNAVAELVFNMGEHRWMGFVHCRAAIRANDWLEAKKQLLDSAWAAQVHATRADRIANYLLTGVYP